MKILGVSAFYHDSAAALLVDGYISGAAQEERFSRLKHDARFPRNAIAWCLKQAGVSGKDLDAVVFYDKPFLKFERILETYLNNAPVGFSSFRKAMPIWITEKLRQKALLVKQLSEVAGPADWQAKLLFTEHHLSHAASAYYASPFDEAVVLTMDGVGEWATTSVCIGRGADLKIVREIHFPHSLGLLYSAFTSYAGFTVNADEYKLMGLAPYGSPIYRETILKTIIDVKPDGSFRLNESYFDFCVGLSMTNRRFEELFGEVARKPNQVLTQFHMDVAASIQAVLEYVLILITRSLSAEFDIPNLCLAGGVALNCVANRKILRDGGFRNVWIQPASGDAGGAIGAAFAGHHLHYGQSRHAAHGDLMRGAFLGPEFSQTEIESQLREAGARFTVLASDQTLIESCIESLLQEKIVGWFQGRMEFGPRALGARSILGDARSPRMQSILNKDIKFREAFRPFGPSVLRERVAEYFDFEGDSPYMLLVADVVRQRRRTLTPEEELVSGLDKLSVLRSDIPSATHVDYSARFQTVHRETNPLYHLLITRFEELTGCAVLINTSFNVRDEPIVCSPLDAFRCFMNTNIDTLAVGRCFVKKEMQVVGCS